LAGEDISDVDIYIHSFDSPKVDTAQTIDELAGRMNDFLTRDEVLSAHEQIVFICHSMGGLVTRAFLLKARPSPQKVPMIYFYVTSTTGANITEIAKYVSRNPQLRDMLPLREDGRVGELQNQWLATSDDRSLQYPLTIASFCAYEKLDTFGLVRIVERQSATNLCNRETRGIVADHMDIVKPRDTSRDAYVFFMAAYMRTFSPTASVIANAWEREIGKPITGQFTETDIPLRTAEQLTLKRVKASSKYIEVGCEETKSGDLSFPAKVDPGETVLQVIPSVENADNIAHSSAALVRFDEDTATVRYFLRGLNKTLLGLNCRWRAC
jgi:hypothetical protein